MIQSLPSASRQYVSNHLTTDKVAKNQLRGVTKVTCLIEADIKSGLNIAAIAHLYAIAEGWAPSLPQAVMAAYQLASKAVAVNSRDAASHAALAACEGYIGRPADAIARAQLATDLNPNFTWAHGNLGMALTFAGRGDEAVAPFNEALRLSPRDPFNFAWHYFLASALFVAGRYEEALCAVEKSVRENPSARAPIGSPPRL